jgi:multidrug resistance efflux pump
MQQHLQNAVTFLRGALIFLAKGIVELSVAAKTHWKISVPAALVLLAGIGALAFFIAPDAASENLDDRRLVSLIAVADVSSGEPITVIGQIQSVSEADVAADASGRVTQVYRSLGEYVAAGSAIGEIENASQRAAVAQAQAALDRAKSGSTLSSISVEGAVTSAESARQAAYGSFADAVRNKADMTFSNADTNPIFFVSIANSQLKNTLEAERLSVGTILKRHESARATVLSETSVLQELDTLAAEVVAVRGFLSNLTLALSGAIPTGSVSQADIAGYQTNASAALAAVTTLQSAIANAVTAVRTAEENLTQGRSGESADVAAAQASLDAAKAALEKTIIRAPISGTINSMSLEKGGFVGAGSTVVRIVNTAGLEAVAYLSERDIVRVAPGVSATVSGIAKGRVTKVAPALDPLTRKAEIRVAVLESARFVAGQSATIEISPVRTQGDTSIFIPISAVKITPETPVVFTLSETGTLVENPVVLGSLSGGKVEVVSGISLSSVIVEDARGLKAGQQVVISQ